MISTSVPFSIALTAGGLAVVNPCAFPLLPAFLSFYLGAEEHRLPAAPTRTLQGLLVGALVAAGFLTVFAVVGLPLSLGLSAIADAVPWLGLATGAALAATGVLALVGISVRLPSSVQLRLRARRRRTAGAMLLFGIGYGAASLGCTLPIFLALIGASLGAAKLTIFAAYAAGMTLVPMALAVTVAFTRQGIARFLRQLLPHINRLAGLLLIASGGYLFYYWYRLRFGNQLTLADDPVVGFASRYSGQLESFARQHGTPLIAIAAAAVALRPDHRPASVLALLSSHTQRNGAGVSKRPGVIVLAAVLLLLAAGCGSGHSANTGASASAAGTPPQLKNIRQLQAVFNSASREPTLVLLVAPT